MRRLRSYPRPCRVSHFIRGEAWLARARTACTASILQFQRPFVSAWHCGKHKVCATLGPRCMITFRKERMLCSDPR